MQMAQGFGIIALVFWVIFMFGSVAAGVFFIIAAWKAMRAHDANVNKKVNHCADEKMSHFCSFKSEPSCSQLVSNS